MEKEEIPKTLSILQRAYGTRPWNWHTRQKPFFVLVSTILSQRTKDPQTDQAAISLLKKYPTPQALALAPLEEIEKLIKNVNYYKTKANRIKKVSEIIWRKCGNKVPDSYNDLISLPGVGPKTANCVLLYGFKKLALPVDTHVHRISNRIGWINTKTPEETEKALKDIIPQEWIPFVNDLLVKHGQTVCLPKVPRCEDCLIRSYCEYGKELFNRSKLKKSSLRG